MDRLASMVVCAAPSYLKSCGAPPNIETLSRHQAVVYRRLGRVRPWLFPHEDGTVEEVMPSSGIRLDDLDAIADAAANGMGLAWVPSWLVSERLRNGTLVRVLPDRRELLYDAYALWLQTPHLPLPLRVRLAVDALCAKLPDQMR